VDADWPAARATHGVLRGTSSAYALQASADALRTGTFDLILANLHLSLWRELAPEIARIAARNAVLVASGFLEAQLAEVETMLSSTGWRITDRSFRDSWFAIRASRSV
jgi:ribosomal protein L11 methylase PrmA